MVSLTQFDDNFYLHTFVICSLLPPPLVRNGSISGVNSGLQHLHQYLRMVLQLVFPVWLSEHLLFVIQQELNCLILQIRCLVNISQHEDINNL